MTFISEDETETYINDAENQTENLFPIVIR